MTIVLTFSMMVSLVPNSIIAQDPIYGGTLFTPMGSDIDTLNMFTQGTTYSSYILDHIYDSLVKYDVDNVPQPILCTAWEYDVTGEIWTFTLREGIVWHDGTPFTADDVIFTWEMLLADDTIPRRSWIYDWIDGFTKIDETHVSVDFSYAPGYADVMIDFATGYIVPEHIWDTVDVHTFTNDAAIGCGPFKLAEYEPAQFFRFEAHTEYHLDGPYVAEKVVQIVRETEAGYYALSTGALDILDGAPPDLVDVAMVDPAIEKHEWLQDYWMYLGLNQRIYPMNIKEFRQAVLYGINRSEIVDLARYGRGLTCPASASLPYGEYYNPDVRDYQFNVALANSMLDDLGFLDSIGDDGIREDANGTDLAFEVMVSAEAQESVDTASLIAGYMADIGIDVTVKPVLFDVLWHEIGGDGSQLYNYEWCLLGWVGFWSDIHPNWASWLFNANGNWGGDSKNIPGWSGDPRANVTALCEEIFLTNDEDEKKDLLDQIQVIVAEDLPYLPLNILGGVTLYRVDEFKGWIMGSTTGPDNWESWLSIQLIEPESGPGFLALGAFLTIVVVVGLVRKRRR
ncbi:MAG: ABC transporter substrate-binding protein [Candidatus Heimdallarchaeota archaeon]|nr:ABC transporter substrate-binding protein [Candidatus Heimdallarchaeota archaeon]